jgi:hypothetical protein
MSFIKTRREYWERFCQSHASLIEKLPSLSLAFSSPERFDDLLQRGETASKDATATLSEIPASDWPTFQEFMRHYQNDWETYFVETLFIAYFKEVAKRGSGST